MKGRVENFKNSIIAIELVMRVVVEAIECISVGAVQAAAA